MIYQLSSGRKSNNEFQISRTEEENIQQLMNYYEMFSFNLTILHVIHKYTLNLLARIDKVILDRMKWQKRLEGSKENEHVYGAQI